MKIFVISLASAHDRRLQCRNAIAEHGLAFDFLDAVDGHGLTDREIETVYDEERNRRIFKRPLSRPEIGCYLSHYRAWEIIAGLSQPAVVLEDDFELSADFSHGLMDLLGRKLPNALIKLEGGKPWSKGGDASGRHDLVEPLFVPPMTTGYLLPPKVARTLVQRALPISRPVDLDLKHWWELGIRVLAVRPDMVRPRKAAVAESSIASARALMKPQSSIHRFHKNIQYQSRFLIGLCRARLQQTRLSLQVDDAG